MNRKIIETAFLDAIKPMLSADWLDASFSTSEADTEKFFPHLSAIIPECVPLSGRLRYGTISLTLSIESRASEAGSGSDEQHAARVKSVTDILEFNGHNYLVAINQAAAPHFDCRGFVESVPEFSIDGIDWKTDIRISAGIVWLA